MTFAKGYGEKWPRNIPLPYIYSTIERGLELERYNDRFTMFIDLPSLSTTIIDTEDDENEYHLDLKDNED